MAIHYYQTLPTSVLTQGISDTLTQYVKMLRKKIRLKLIGSMVYLHIYKIVDMVSKLHTITTITIKFTKKFLQSLSWPHY